MKNLLRNNILEITFTKTNGEERVMLCTLHEDYLPVGGSGNAGVERPGIVTVWDIEADGWRCFKEDAVTSMKVSAQC